MGDIEILNKFDNDKLIDVVKNYKRYGYDDELRDYAINLLGERGWSREDLQQFGYLTNYDYDVYLIFLILAYRNVAKFYNALGRNQDETALFNALGVLAYFHLKGRMKEELKGIR